MRIAYIFNTGRLNRLERLARKECPTEFFLGFPDLASRGYDVLPFEIDAAVPPGWFGGLINVLSARGVMPEKLTGGVFEQIKPILPQLNSVDCIVATTSGIAFALAHFKIAKRLLPPIVAIHCGLVNNDYGYLKKTLTSVLLRQMQTALYGDGERNVLVSMFPELDSRINVVQFGVDPSFWMPGGERKNYILSVGNDGRRDFLTLLRAAPLINSEIVIVTSHHLPEPIPPNVRWIKGSWHSEALSDVELRTLYQEAACVAVILRNSFQPSGQSVVLQAMACGTPVVLTKTDGLWSKELITDGENVVFVKEGNSDDIVQKIHELAVNESLRSRIVMNGLDVIRSHASITEYAKGIEKLCLKVCANR